jgi:hypothetical protein
MIKTQYLGFRTSIKLSADNIPAEQEFLTELSYDVPRLLKSSSHDKDAVISKLRLKYGICLDYEDFGGTNPGNGIFQDFGTSNVEVEIDEEYNEDNVLEEVIFQYYGNNFNCFSNVRYLALVVQAYFRKFRQDGFLAVHCSNEYDGKIDSDNADHMMLIITAEKVELISLDEIAAQKKMQHEQRKF